MDDEPTIFSFWKNHAKLSILDPETGVRNLLVLFGVLVAISGLLHLWRPVGMEELYVQSAYFVALIAVFGWVLASEMFFKGGRAAKDIKSAGDDRHAEKFDEWNRLAGEFTQYRIAKEEEVK